MKPLGHRSIYARFTRTALNWSAYEMLRRHTTHDVTAKHETEV